MKNVLALALSLLMPAVPVLADGVADQSQRAQSMNANADQLAQSLQDPRTPPALAGAQTTPPPADPNGAPPAAGAQTGVNLDRSAVGNISTAPAKTKQKPSFFSKMKANIINFATKHPVIAGAILGGMLCAFGGPAIFVIGVSLGAVAGDVASYAIGKLKHHSS